MYRDSFAISAEDGGSWPRITVVTPSFNQGEYIEETIRSVLDQGYPNLEYMIFDGGSTDGTLDVIRKYESHLAYWESRPDRGQAHAINKGFERATGDVIAWINSDDYYLPGALEKVAKAHLRNPDALIVGHVEEFDDFGLERLQTMHHIDIEHLLRPMDGSWMWHQPGTFVPKKVRDRAGQLDESLHYAFDKDWLFRLLQHAHVEYLDDPLARFRIHPEAKTSADMDKTMHEIFSVNRRYLHLSEPRDRRRLLRHYHRRLAGLYLCEHPEYGRFVNRGRALTEMLAAPSMLFSMHGLRLLYRALTPRMLWRNR